MTFTPGQPVICDRALSAAPAKGIVMSTYVDGAGRTFVSVYFGNYLGRRITEDLLAEDVRAS